MKQNRWTWIVIFVIAASLVYAWLYRHLDDDAFITFRYSQHLVEGMGPIWNPDQHVEGYSNFLWMLAMSLPIALGLDPGIPAILIALGFLALNLWLSYRLACRLQPDDRLSFWIWLPIAFCHTLLIGATSGLETSMNAFLWTWAFFQCFNLLQLQSKWPDYLRLGFILGLAMLSRPEGFFLTFAVIMVLMTKPRSELPALPLLAMLLPIMLLVLPWLAWKAQFYGDLLPNTFYVKTEFRSLHLGFRYVGLLLLTSGVGLPLLLLGWRGMQGIVHRWDRGRMMAMILVLGMLAYGFLIGGDYLEFRLMAPILPILLMLPLTSLSHTPAPWKLKTASLGMALILMLWGQGHGRFLFFSKFNPLISEAEFSAETLSFVEQGKAWGALLEHDQTLRLAIGAAGAIPYYTKFYSIDLYGLNEPHASFSSHATGYGPGHAHQAEYAYLLGRRPHLISLFCIRQDKLEPDRRYSHKDQFIAPILGDYLLQNPNYQCKVAEILLPNGFVEICLYPNSHPRIEALRKNNQLNIFDLE